MPNLTKTKLEKTLLINNFCKNKALVK